jgi:hypothetical protein
MNIRGKRPALSPALFALICLAFLLPFATVSCDAAETSFNGVQLLTRTVPPGGQVAESDCNADLSTCVEDKGSLLAELAFAAALLGLALGVLGKGKGPGWCAVGGLLAILGIAAQSFEPLGPTVTFHVGYWLLLLLFLWAMCLHAGRAVRRRRAARLVTG